MSEPETTPRNDGGSDHRETPARDQPIPTNSPPESDDHLPETLREFMRHAYQGVEATRLQTRRPEPAYDKAHMLFLRWQDEDLKTQPQIDNLWNVMQHLRLTQSKDEFTTSQYDIPSEYSSLLLERELVVKVADFARKPGELLVVYYGGHAKMDERGRCIWYPQTGGPAPGHGTEPQEADWTKLRRRLNQGRGDVVVILDCCYIHTTAGEDSMDCCYIHTMAGEDPMDCEGLKEMLVAGRGHEKTPGALDNRFTEALTDELKRLQGRTCTLSTLHASLVERQEYHRLENVPARIGLSDRANRFENLRLIFPNDNYSDELLNQDEISLDYGARALVLVRLHDLSPRHSDWSCWLRKQVGVQIKGTGLIQARTGHVRVEAGFSHTSTLLFLSLPITVWNIMPRDPSYSFIDMMSGNLISPTPPPVTDHYQHEDDGHYPSHD